MARSSEERDDGRLDAREVACDPPEHVSRPVLDEEPASRRDFLKQAMVGTLGARRMLAGAAGLGAAAGARSTTSTESPLKAVSHTSPRAPAWGTRATL